MPTIEIGGSPYAYGDMRDPNNPQQGPTLWDDQAPTLISATATVTNQGGTAAGHATMELRDMDYDPDGQRVPGSSTDEANVNPMPPATLGARLSIAYIGHNLNAVKTYGVFILDTSVEKNLSRAPVLTSRTFTVNSYETPRIANLSSGTIDIRVS